MSRQLSSSERVSRRLAPTLALAIAIAAGLATAWAQEAPGPAQKPEAAGGEELAERDPVLESYLLNEGEKKTIYAAVALFQRRRDALLIEVLSRRELGRQRRLWVLRALEIHGRDRPLAACAIARSALRDADAAIREAARRLMVENEPLSAPPPAPTIDGTAYAFLRDAVIDIAERAIKKQASPADLAEAATLLAVLEDKKDPLRAARALIDTLPKLSGALEARALSALTNITGAEEVADWEAWYARESQRSRADWMARRQRQRDARQAADLARVEAAAIAIFDKLIRRLGEDDEALLKELRAALRRDQIAALRLRAIAGLGELGAHDSDAGASAVATLIALLQQGSSLRAEELAVYSALGRTGKKEAVAPLVARFTTDDRGAVRVLVDALAGLPYPGALAALADRLRLEVNKSGPDPAFIVRLIAALQVLAIDPDGRNSGVLVQTIRAFQGAEGKASPEQRGRVLLAAAEALGRLSYSDPRAEAMAEEALSSLARETDTTLRLLVAFSLGRLGSPGVCEALKLLAADTELRVREAAIAGFGRWGRRPERSDDERGAVIEELVIRVLGTDRGLQPRLRDELRSFVKADFKESLENLTSVVKAFRAHKHIALALPYLTPLGPDDGVGRTKEQRFRWLIAARAEARLAAARAQARKADRRVMAQAALEDINALARSPRAEDAERLRLYGAEAQLLLDKPRAACALLTKSLFENQAWGLWLEGALRLQRARRARELAELMATLPDKARSDEQRRALRKLDLWLQSQERTGAEKGSDTKGDDP